MRPFTPPGLVLIRRIALETTSPEAPERPRRPWAAIAVLAGVFAAHLVQSVATFPTPRALLDDDHPVLLVDHAVHLYHGALGSRFLLRRGTTWGYDPFFMAGYPETPVWDSSSNPSILFQALAGGGYHPRAYNLGLLACSILVLASVVAGAAASGVGPMDAAMATLVGWLYFRCAWPDMFWRSGLFAFVTASAGTVLLAGLLLRYEERPGLARWGGVAVSCAVLWFTHVTAPVLAIGAVSGLALTAIRRRSWRWFAALAGSAALAAAVNAFWLAPLWSFRGIRSVQGLFMAPASSRVLLNEYRSPSLDGRLSLAILVLGVIGLGSWLAERRRSRAATFGGAALVCLALAMYGGQWTVTRTLEPLRFKVPLHFLLAVPAGSALARGTARLARAAGGRRRGVVAAVVAWSAVLAAAALAEPRTVVQLARSQTVPRPLVAGLRPEMRRMVDWLRENTDPSARILFEDQLRLLENTDPESTHWTPLLPVLLGREPRQFIGGLYASAFITHHRYASFADFHLGGRAIDEWSPARLRQFCEMYNVGWVVCWSPLSRLCFDQWSDAHRVATLPRHHSPDHPVAPNFYELNAMAARVGADLATRYMKEGERQYAVYRVERPRTFILSGTGRVASVDLNRVELADVVPQDGAVVLSLHWLDTWRSDPPLRLDPLPVPDDPVPFVRISTARSHGRIVLTNDYGR